MFERTLESTCMLAAAANARIDFDAGGVPTGQLLFATWV